MGDSPRKEATTALGGVFPAQPVVVTFDAEDDYVVLAPFVDGMYGIKAQWWQDRGQLRMGIMAAAMADEPSPFVSERGSIAASSWPVLPASAEAKIDAVRAQVVAYWSQWRNAFHE